MATGEIKRVPYPEHPDRCTARGQGGQCMNFRVEGMSVCLIHGGNHGREAKAEQELKNYRLTLFKARLLEKKLSPDLKSLREEIAILRMMLEEQLNQCKSDTDLILHAAPISDLVMKIEKLVASCQKLEASTGSLVDRAAILQFASKVVTIISEEIKDEAILDRISQKVIQSIQDTESEINEGR